MYNPKPFASTWRFHVDVGGRQRQQQDEAVSIAFPVFALRQLTLKILFQAQLLDSLSGNEPEPVGNLPALDSTADLYEDLEQVLKDSRPRTDTGNQSASQKLRKSASAQSAVAQKSAPARGASAQGASLSASGQVRNSAFVWPPASGATWASGLGSTSTGTAMFASGSLKRSMIGRPSTAPVISSPALSEPPRRIRQEAFSTTATSSSIRPGGTFKRSNDHSWIDNRKGARKTPPLSLCKLGIQEAQPAGQHMAKYATPRKSNSAKNSNYPPILRHSWSANSASGIQAKRK